MSTVTLRIQVDKAGASENINAVKGDLRGMGETGAQAGQQAAGGVNALKGAINSAKEAIASFIAVYAGIRTLAGIVNLADEYQGLTDRLKLATGSTAEFEAAQSGVFAIAQQTGTALSAVGGLYVSLTNSTNALGLSQGELQTITQAVSQSFIVSGASAQQTDAAIRQLGQGFASGVLRGDEFNSMMENAPSLAAALAASLGVTTGELRAMAAEGKLTSDVLAQGLLQQAPAIAAQFDQMGTTVGQAFTRLSNSVLQFVGEASQSTGAASALATVITGIANGLPAFAFGLAAVAAGYAAVSLAAIGANAGLFTTMGLVGALATGFGALIVAYSAYKLGEYLVNEFAIVQAAVRSLYVGLNDAWTAIKVGALQAVAAVRVAFITAFDAITDRLADLIEAFVSFSQIELPLGLRADFAYGQAEAMTELARRVRDATDAAVENDAVTGDLKAEMDAARAEAERYAADMFDAVDSLKAGKTATEGATTATKALTPVVNAAAKATKDAADAVDLHAQALGVIRKSTIAYTSGLGTAVQSLANVTTATDTTRGAVDEFGNTIDESGRSSLEWQRYWEGAVGAVSDAFGDFVASGFKSFEDLKDGLVNIAKQIVSDLVSTFIRSRITIPITTALSGGGQAGAAGGGGIGALLSNPFALVAGAIGAISALASLFGRDKPPDVRFGGESASIRNREGRFSTVFGGVQAGSRQISYEDMIEPIQQFDLAIQGIVQATGGGAEQLDAIRGALSTWEVDLRGSAATAENVLGSRFNAILSAFGSDVQGFVGNAGTLEERLGRFTDALGIAAAAASDNGISSSFDDLATLFTRFRLQGESVSDTFQRLSFGVGLIDDTLLMLGGTFNGTRLQAATFAGELIELAGGLDQFSARLNGALEALFSEPERNQFLLDQARQSLNSALAGLNIGGVGIDNIREQLRTQLRDALAAGNSALVNQLLIAGNALGSFSTAVGRVGDSAEGLLSGPFGTSIGSSGGIGRPGQLVSPAGTAVQTQIQAVQSTNTILNGHTAILTRIALASERGTGPRDPSSGGSLGPGSLGGGSPKSSADPTAVLVQIKGLIEQAVRTQVTEALKRTTGANKRAAAV